MKRFALSLIPALLLSACGDSAPSFAGRWSGSFNRLKNNCPFAVAEDINPLFPMTVTVDANDVFTVVAVDGSTAVGGQGNGETISFLATSDSFGNYGTTSPFTCESSRSQVAFLAIGDDEADVTLTLTFTNCTSPSSGSDSVCTATYYGEARRLSS